MRDAPILIDVSRLIWRQWTRRLPTGIDRVCLAYLQRFHEEALAVVQFRRFRRILDRRGSARLFDLLLNGSGHFQSSLTAILAATAVRAESSAAGQIYLNVGHTGLNSPYLGPWLARHVLRPLFLIHDLIPITHPQYCREGEAVRHEQRMETALRSASGLIVNSAATQLALARFASDRGLPLPPTLIAWLGIDPAPIQTTISHATRKRPYFVMIGTIEARKNHLLILQTWSELVAEMGDQAPDLIIIGQRGWEAGEAISMLDDPGALQGHVHELARCDDGTMRNLLAGARAMLMPSFVEGFGLPVVEALQLAVPVIASDLPVFREIAGDVPTFLDPADRQAWVKAIAEFADDGPERRRQLIALRAFAAPDWRSHFALVEDFLASLPAGGPSPASPF